MTRLILDTCAVIELITSSDTTELEFWNIIDDPNVMLFASFETARELVVHFNNKTLLSKHWQTARQMLTSIEQDYGIEFLPLRRDTAFTYADLQLNEEQAADTLSGGYAVMVYLGFNEEKQFFLGINRQGIKIDGKIFHRMIAQKNRNGAAVIIHDFGAKLVFHGFYYGDFFKLFFT